MLQLVFINLVQIGSWSYISEAICSPDQMQKNSS